MKGLIKGVDYFSLADLFRKAAALKKIGIIESQFQFFPENQRIYADRRFAEIFGGARI